MFDSYKVTASNGACIFVLVVTACGARTSHETGSSQADPTIDDDAAGTQVSSGDTGATMPWAGTPLGMLTVDQLGEVCDAFVSAEGGYGAVSVCPWGTRVEVPATRSECIASVHRTGSCAGVLPSAFYQCISEQNGNPCLVAAGTTGHCLEKTGCQVARWCDSLGCVTCPDSVASNAECVGGSYCYYLDVSGFSSCGCGQSGTPIDAGRNRWHCN
jgi:hypothetical protein